MFRSTVNLAKSHWHRDFVKHLSVTYVEIMVPLTMFSVDPNMHDCPNGPYFELKFVVPKGGGYV